MIFSKPLYYIRRVKDHMRYRNSILSHMSTLRRNYEHLDQKGSHKSYISNTDWDYNSPSYHKTWLMECFSPEATEDYINFLRKKYGGDNEGFKVGDMWFNQYYPKSGSEHAFHNHVDSIHNNDLTNIYYVELGDKSLRTILKHPVTGKEIVPRVNEGDMLIFDAKIFHKSPRNFSPTRKSIISFNISLQ